MPKISDVCEFVVQPSQTYLQTNINGDTLTIAGVHFTQEQAASLGWLLNGTEDLKIKVKQK